MEANPLDFAPHLFNSHVGSLCYLQCISKSVALPIDIAARQTFGYAFAVKSGADGRCVPGKWREYSALDRESFGGLTMFHTLSQQ